MKDINEFFDSLDREALGKRVEANLEIEKQGLMESLGISEGEAFMQATLHRLSVLQIREYLAEYHNWLKDQLS